MSKLVFGLLTAAGLLAATPSLANSNFPNTCSNTHFAWSASGQATIQSTCLQSNGAPHSTSLVLTGISNQGGILTKGAGDSTFQKSCGSIQVLANNPGVVLSAICRAGNGSGNPTSMPLNNIDNVNGNLVQH